MAEGSTDLNAELWSYRGLAELVTNARTTSRYCSIYCIYNPIEIVFYNKEITPKYLQRSSQTTPP